MIGIDTNLLVRLFTNDDKAQAQRVVTLLENNHVFVAKSVFLETEWVLRYTYDLSSKVILQAFKNLLGLEQVTVEDPIGLLQSLAWYEQGFDFADALHLAASTKTSKFATFDKAFVKKAKKVGIHLLAL